MRKRIVFLIWLLPLLSILIITQASAQENFLEQVLSPFAGLNLADTYENYHQVIDFFLYLIIFIGLSKVTLGRLFPGRGGKAVVVGVGLVLSVSLAVMEGAMNFNLKAFGPIAGGIFILLVGIVLFLGIRHAGASVSGSTAIAFVVTYFSLASVSPNIFDWLTMRMPFINGVLAVALIIAIWQLVSSIWPKSERALAAAEETLRRPMVAAKNVFPTVSALWAEEKLIKSRLEKITKKEIKESREIINDLKEMQKIIDEYGKLPVGRALIARKIDEIRPKVHHAEKALVYINELNKKLEAFDISEFSKLTTQYEKLSAEEKAIFKKQILEQREKIKCEEKIKAFEKAIEQYNKDFIYALSQAAANLNAGHQENAKKWLGKAIKLEEFIVKEFRRMKKLEKELIGLTRYEIKLSKKQKK